MRAACRALLLPLLLALSACGRDSPGTPAPTPPSPAPAQPTLVAEVGKPVRTPMPSLGKDYTLEVHVHEVVPAGREDSHQPAQVRYSLHLRRGEETADPAGFLQGDEVDLLPDGGKLTITYGTGPDAYFVEATVRVVDAAHVAWTIHGRRGD